MQWVVWLCNRPPSFAPGQGLGIHAEYIYSHLYPFCVCYDHTVPDAPTINVIPTYSQQNDSLLRITISFPEMVMQSYLLYNHIDLIFSYSHRHLYPLRLAVLQSFTMLHMQTILLITYVTLRQLCQHHFVKTEFAAKSLMSLQHLVIPLFK